MTFSGVLILCFAAAFAEGSSAASLEETRSPPGEAPGSFDLIGNGSDRLIAIELIWEFREARRGSETTSAPSL